MGELSIRLAGPGDANAIFERMEEAREACAASDWFYADSLDYIREHMEEEKGFVAAAFDGEEAAAFLIVKYFEEGKESIISFLKLSKEEERACAVMDSAAVGKAWRGRGLMRSLLLFGEQRLPKEKRILLSTVHPDNVYSLRNLLALGYEPIEKICCYGGRTRLLLVKKIG